MQIWNENCSIIKTIILLKILEKFGPIEHTEKCNNSLKSSGDFTKVLVKIDSFSHAYHMNVT